MTQPEMKGDKRMSYLELLKEMQEHLQSSYEYSLKMASQQKERLDAVNSLIARVAGQDGLEPALSQLNCSADKL